MPLGKIPSILENDSFSGKKTGLNLCLYINSKFPNIKLAMFSGIRDPEIRFELIKNKIQFIPKPNFSEVVKFIKIEISHTEKITKPRPNIFIVHGHDEKLLGELKKYIQNTLKLGYPIVLKEKPSEGNTIIEKLEKYSENVDLVFILLTPDDFILVKKNGESCFQARPNVIFELGYFMGILNRKTGRIITLVKSEISMFSDLAGIIHIDVSNGILSASENIKGEIAYWL